MQTLVAVQVPARPELSINACRAPGAARKLPAAARKPRTCCKEGGWPAAANGSVSGALKVSLEDLVSRPLHRGMGSADAGLKT